MSTLTNKVAVVTGASKGIGASIAKNLAEAGASVVVNYATDKQGAGKVVAEIVKADGKAIAVQASVSVESEVVVMLAATQKAFGKVDILVNNAGAYAFSAIEAVTLEDFNRQFTTNVFELLLVTKTGLLFSPRRAAASSTSAQWSAPWPRQREVFTPAPKPPLIRSRKRSRRNSDPKISV